MNHLLVDLRKNDIFDIKDLKSFLLKHKIVSKNCYLRFKEYIDKAYSWIDITSDSSPYPVNKDGVV